jgi:hypothetical protein
MASRGPFEHIVPAFQMTFDHESQQTRQALAAREVWALKPAPVAERRLVELQEGREHADV